MIHDVAGFLTIQEDAGLSSWRVVVRTRAGAWKTPDGAIAEARDRVVRALRAQASGHRRQAKTLDRLAADIARG